jgi:hypothetical protein
MDELETLQSLGLELPSPAYIAGVIVFSVIGMVAYWRGRKAGIPRRRWLGLALMLYPYVVPNTVLMYVVGVLLSAGLLLDRT